MLTTPGDLVMRYAIAAIYTNYTSRVISDQGFGRKDYFAAADHVVDEVVLKFDRVS